jgi:hypothetical protein
MISWPGCLGYHSREQMVKEKNHISHGWENGGQKREELGCHHSLQGYTLKTQRLLPKPHLLKILLCPSSAHLGTKPLTHWVFEG